MTTLNLLLNFQPIAFYKIVEKCREPQHQMFGNSEEKAKEFGLIESDGKIQNHTKNIILSAAEGKYFDLKLTSPVVEEVTPQQNP